LIALQLGIDAMWLDFDIFLVRNPGRAIVEALNPAARKRAPGPYDVLMGYDYDSDCLCNGFFYLRARPRVHRWLFELVRWLYDHPFEHDQRAISAFLNYTELITASPEELPPVPRWHVFDVENAFINWGSWEGSSFEELTLVHFVDGSAWTLYGRPTWDASIPETKRRQLAAEGGGAADTFSPMDAFYSSEVVNAAPEELLVATPSLPDQLSVRRLLVGQRRPKPTVKQPCGILPGVSSAHVGYGWLTQDGSEPPWMDVPPDETDAAPVDAFGFGVDI